LGVFQSKNGIIWGDNFKGPYRGEPQGGIEQGIFCGKKRSLEFVTGVEVYYLSWVVQYGGGGKQGVFRRREDFCGSPRGWGEFFRACGGPEWWNERHQ